MPVCRQDAFGQVPCQIRGRLKEHEYVPVVTQVRNTKMLCSMLEACGCVARSQTLTRDAHACEHRRSVNARLALMVSSPTTTSEVLKQVNKAARQLVHAAYMRGARTVAGVQVRNALLQLVSHLNMCIPSTVVDAMNRPLFLEELTGLAKMKEEAERNAAAWDIDSDAGDDF